MGFPLFNASAATYSHLWFAKVLRTLFIHSNRDEFQLEFLRISITASLAFEIIKFLGGNNLGFQFFEFTRSNFNLKHLPATFDILARSLCDIGFHGSAKTVLDCMINDAHSPNRSTLAFFFYSVIQSGKPKIACEFLNHLQKHEVKLDISVYNKLLNALVKENHLNLALTVFTTRMNYHCTPDTFTFNTIILGLCRAGKFDKALLMFNDMGRFSCSPDVITYNTMISGLCRANEVHRGRRLFEEMVLNRHVSADVFTFTSIVSGYCRLGNMGEASFFFKKMEDFGIRPSAVTFNVYIDGLLKGGDLSSAYVMYEKMLRFGFSPDVVTFTLLIDGLCKAGQVDEGLKLWRKMEAQNVRPNEYTFSVLIHALCKQNKLSEARDLLRHPTWLVVGVRPFMYNPLVDSLCKVGDVDEAMSVVREVEGRCRPDKLTYTSLVIGYCVKGRVMEAIDVFREMLGAGCAPDDIIVVSLRSHLLKAGMADEAHRIVEMASTGLNSGFSVSKRGVGSSKENNEILAAA